MITGILITLAVLVFIVLQIFCAACLVFVHTVNKIKTANLYSWDEKRYLIRTYKETGVISLSISELYEGNEPLFTVPGLSILIFPFYFLGVGVISIFKMKTWKNLSFKYKDKEKIRQLHRKQLGITPDDEYA